MLSATVNGELAGSAFPPPRLPVGWAAGSTALASAVAAPIPGTGSLAPQKLRRHSLSQPDLRRSEGQGQHRRYRETL